MEKSGLDGKCLAQGLMEIPSVCTMLNLVCLGTGPFPEAAVETRRGQKWCLRGDWDKAYSIPSALTTAFDYDPNLLSLSFCRGNLEQKYLLCGVVE